MDFSQFPVTIVLIALNVIYSFIGFSNETLVNKTIMWPYYVQREKQYYRFITSGFLHADMVHLFFNMFTLFFFGKVLEPILSAAELGGSLSYILLYAGGLVISDIPSYLKNRNVSSYRSLGASGAVSAVVFGTIVFNPWGSIYLYAAIKISATVYAILFVIYCVFMGKRGADNVNHDAHLWGSLFGLVFILCLIGVLQPALFEYVIEELKRPSLFGRP